jgi:uncharacterized membrane protein
MTSLSTLPTETRQHPTRRQTTRRWTFIVTCVAIALIAPMPYLTQSLEDLSEGGVGLAQHYVDQPGAIRLALIVHASFAGLALLLTPIQSSSRIRRRWVRIHRVSGRVSFVAIVVAALSGLVIAQVSYAGAQGTVGFMLLAMVWLVSAVRAVTNARNGDLGAHRRWAVRTMAMSYAAVTLRLWLILFIAIQRPTSSASAQAAFDNAYPFVPFLSWVPNLIVAEWLVRRPRHFPTTPHA